MIFMKKISGSYYNFLWLLVAVAVLIIDQTSKYWAMYHLPLREFVPVSPFFNLFFNYNTGAAFSLLEEASGWQQWFFSILAIIISTAIINWLYKMERGKDKFLKIALMLVMGGAIGNLIDRIFFGGVRDFLDFYWRTHHWPTFNLADSAICVGAFLLAIFFLCKEERKE